LANVRAYYALAITPMRGGTGGLYFTNYDADVPIIQSVNTSDVAQSLLLNPLGGNVGIGTTAPSSTLHVYGDAVHGDYYAAFIENSGGGRVLKLYNSDWDATDYLIYASNGGTASIGYEYIVTGNAQIHLTSSDAYQEMAGGNGTPGTDSMLFGQNSTKVGYVWNRSTAATAHILFGTSGTERMRITNDGDVGIGTPSPTKDLDVRAEARIWNGANGIELSYSTGNTSGIVASANTSGNLEFRTDVGAAAKMFITNAGNVGIGTGSPGAKLNVVGSGTMGWSDLANAFGLFGSTTAGIGIDDNEIACKGDMYFGTINSGNDIIIRAGGATQSMIVKSGGNVGIGTNTSPTEKLHVQTSSNNVGRFESTDGVAYIQINDTADSVYVSTESQIGSIGGNVGAHDDNLNIKLVTGYVGIGTTSIDEKLQVEEGNIKIEGGQNSSTVGLIIAHGGQTGNTVNLVQNSTASRGHLYTTDRALRIEAGSAGSTGTGETLDFWVNGSERMMIDTTGKVGINTTAPVAKLEVNGGIIAGGKTTYTISSASLTTTGTAVAGLSTGTNLQSSGFIFTCFGGDGFQRIVYSCRNESGTWNIDKDIDEGVNAFDVTYAADGSDNITFTFKSRSGTQSYAPRVTVEAMGDQIQTSYIN
jgi:hypothetical protein